MPDDKQRREFRQLMEASAIGWMFPIAMGLGFAWGYGMDKLFGTWPWLTDGSGPSSGQSGRRERTC